MKIWDKQNLKKKFGFLTNIINQINQKYDDENNVDSNDSKEESLIPKEDEKEKKKVQQMILK